MPSRFPVIQLYAGTICNSWTIHSLRLLLPQDTTVYCKHDLDKFQYICVLSTLRVVWTWGVMLGQVSFIARYGSHLFSLHFGGLRTAIRLYFTALKILTAVTFKCNERRRVASA